MTYRDEVLADSPSAYWRLGEGAGVTAVDETGNGHDLTYAGGPSLGVSGLLVNDADTAVQWNGSEYAQRASFTGLDGVGFVAVEGWIQLTETTLGGPTPKVMLDLWTPSNVDDVVVYFNLGATAGDGQLSVGFRGNYFQLAGMPLNDGVPHHIVAQWRNTDGLVEVWVDGELRFTTTGVAVAQTVGSGGTITLSGNSNDGSTVISGSWFVGAVMDEWAVYPSFLSAGRIVDHYNAGLDTLANPFIRRVELAEVGIGGAARYHPNAVFYVPLDEPQGSGTVTDVIGGKTGTVTVAGVGADLGVAAQVGTGINFVGTDQDRIAFAADPAFGVFGKAGFTVEAWIYLRSLGGSFPRLATNENAAGTIGWRASFNTVGSGFNVALIVNGDSGSYDARGVSGELPFNVWHHVVLAWDSATDLVEVFVDGLPNQVAQVAGVGAPVDDTGQPMHIGESPGAAINRNPDGIIDNFAIYHRALEQREAHSSYTRGRYRRPLQDLVTPPVSHWKFDGDATDSGTAGDDGSLVNAPGFVVGQVGSAVDLNGSNQYVSLPTTVGTTLSGVAGFTFEAWIQPAGSAAVFSGILDLRRVGGGPHQAFLALNSNTGVMQLASLPDAGDTQANRFYNAGLAGPSPWTHVVITIDVANKEMRAYQNGDLIAVFDESGSWTASVFDGVTLDAQIGLDPNGGNHFDGLIDDARIHHRVVSAAEVRANYRANLDRFLVRVHFTRAMDPTTVENPTNWSTIPAVTFNDISLEPDGFYADFDISEIQGFEPVLYLMPGAGVLSEGGDPIGGEGATRILQPSAFISTPSTGELVPFTGPDLEGDLVAGIEDAGLPFIPDIQVRRLAYLMRAFKNTPTTGYVFWQVLDTPDFAADQAPVPAGELEDIVVDDTYVVQG